MTHSDSPANGLEHLQVVRVIANCHDLCQRNSQSTCKRRYTARFTTACGHNRQFCPAKVATSDSIPGNGKGTDFWNEVIDDLLRGKGNHTQRVGVPNTQDRIWQTLYILRKSCQVAF